MEEVIVCPLVGVFHVTRGLVVSMVKVIQVVLPSISVSAKTLTPSQVISVPLVYADPLSVMPERLSQVK
jgi:hypothetical protein